MEDINGTEKQRHKQRKGLFVKATCLFEALLCFRSIFVFFVRVRVILFIDLCVHSFIRIFT